MPGSCSPTAAASSSRGADSAAIAREVIGLLGDEREAPGARRTRGGVRPRHDLAGGGAALPRELRAARARTRGAAPDAIPGADAREPARELPEVNLEHLRLMTDETGILQHADFSVPRYDEGYCLDDNARALLLMALLEDAGDRRRRRRPRARRALPRVRESRVRPRERALPQLHVVRAAVDRGRRLRRQPRPRDLGARHGRRTLDRSGPAESRRRAVSRRPAGGARRSRARARGRTRCSASPSTCARSGRQPRADRRARSSPSDCSTCSDARARPTGRGSKIA